MKVYMTIRVADGSTSWVGGGVLYTKIMGTESLPNTHEVGRGDRVIVGGDSWSETPCARWWDQQGRVMLEFPAIIVDPPESGPCSVTPGMQRDNYAKPWWTDIDGDVHEILRQAGWRGWAEGWRDD